MVEKLLERYRPLSFLSSGDGVFLVGDECVIWFNRFLNDSDLNTILINKNDEAYNINLLVVYNKIVKIDNFSITLIQQNFKYTNGKVI